MRAFRTDDMRDHIAAYPFPRGGVEVVRANRGYTLYSRRTLLPACAQPARATRFRCCGGKDRHGLLPATSAPLSCRSTKLSNLSPRKAFSGSMPEVCNLTKRAKSS
jgi:hypothetical protein